MKYLVRANGRSPLPRICVVLFWRIGSTALTYKSNLLGSGSQLDPKTGLFEWTPAYFQAGEFEIPLGVSDGESITTQTTKLTVLNVNAAPVFEGLTSWSAQEGEVVRFRAFAFDPDNPGFVPLERNSKGELTILEGSDPTVTYTVSGLPIGASFDVDTAMFSWTPGYTSAGTYNVTFTATDDGNGTANSKTTSITVPITIRNTNRAPLFENVTISDGVDTSNPTKVNITTFNSNGTPVTDNNAFTNVNVNRGEVKEIVFKVTDLESDALGLTLGLERNALEGIPDYMTWRDNGDGTLSLRIAPDSIAFGNNYTFKLVATEIRNDGAEPLKQELIFNVNIIAPNNAPVIGYIGDKVTLVGQPIELIVNTSDRDGDPLSYSFTGLPESANATLTPTDVYGQSLFKWTPTASDVGQAFNVSIKVVDSGNNGKGDVLEDSETFKISVRTSNNTPLAVQYGQENNTVTFKLLAEDGDRSGVEYRAISALPQGAILDSRTGEFTWKPNYNQSGEHTLKFAATDPLGASALLDVVVSISNVNRAPSLTVSDRAVALGNTLSFLLNATDPDILPPSLSPSLPPSLTPPLTYSAVNLPEGATLDAVTGQFSWKPSPGQVGNYSVTFNVSDGETTTAATALIQVALTPVPPTVTLDLTPSFPAIPGQKVVVQTQATGLAAITSLTATVDGQPVALDTNGRISLTPNNPGRYLVSAVATDADGRTGSTSAVIKVRDVNDNAAPVVAFAPGFNGSKITNTVNIAGSITDTNLDEWVLELADFNSDKFIAIASGTQTVDGVLSQFNPSTYVNGFYQLRLSATDISGRTSTTTANIEVSSHQKNAYIRQETDLTTTIGGVTINLVRTYNSLLSDEALTFGNGWRLANTDANIQTLVQQTRREHLGVYNPLSNGTRLYLTTPTGERIGFTFAPQKVTMTGVTYYTPAWLSDVAGYKLESVDAKLTASGNSFYDMKTGVAYNPASGKFEGYEYKLTTADGNIYYLSTAKGVVEQVATNGTHLIYSDSGITSSTGETIRFVKDAQGRLEQITTPDSTLVKYTYEGSHLVAARNLSTGNVSRYGYSSLPPSLSPSPTLPLPPSSSLLTLATGNPGTPGSAISYGATPQVSAIKGDLGGAVLWNGKTTTGVGNERYTFSLRDSEFNSTATGIVLIGVDVTGGSVSALNGLTPMVSQSGYALYAIAKTGLSLVEVASNGTYNLQLTIAGDINRDGLVDGVDSDLLDVAILSGSYNVGYDFNRDGVLNAADVQILGSNYGFRANRAPVVTPTNVLTHVDLDTTVALNKLATDPEGDPVFFRIVSTENGNASLTADGESVLFTPNDNYFGAAGFTLVADDGYSTSAPVKVDINVSNAALINLDFAKRGLRLDKGESTELVVIGDFADQQDVILPYSYLQFTSVNGHIDALKPTVASVSSAGVVSALNDGVSILRAWRNEISAVTALRVGELLPTREAEFNIELVEENGLNVYPKAVMLPNGGTRQLLVGIEGIYGSPDLKDITTETSYFISNSDILQVDANGLITALKEGIASVTVIHGASEYVVPVRVEAPQTIRVAPGVAAQTQMSTDGGIVEVEVLDADNSIRTMQVMVAPGTLFEDTNLRITPLLNEQLLSLPTPQGFQFLSGFKLEAGNDPLMLPVQLAIELPENLKADASLVGKTVYFFEKDIIPDVVNGGEKETWLVAESGVIGADGMIRTQSPPWGGVRDGEYMMGIDDFSLPGGGVRLVKGKLTVTYNMPAIVSTLLPASYTVSNGLSSISIGNLDSNIAIANNYNRAYATDEDGNFAVKVFDDSLLVKYEQISVEIKGVAQEILALVSLIQILNKEKTTLEKDVQELERVYQRLEKIYGFPLRAALTTEAPPAPTIEKEIEIQKETTRKEIIKKQEELSIVREKIQENTQKKESFELRRHKLDDQLGSLRGLLRAYSTAGNILGLLDTAPFLSITYDISSLKVIQVPAVGLPQVTETGVQLNAGNLPSFEINLGIPTPQTSGPAAPPVLQQASLRFQDESNQPYPDKEPVLFLTGSNILVNNGDDPLGSSFEDLIVNFQMGSTRAQGTVLADLSEYLPDNRFKVAVKVPKTVVLGMSDITIIRRQNQIIDRVGPLPIKREIKFESNEIQLEPTGEYIFGTQRLSDLVSVIDGRDPKALFNDPSSNVQSSADLLLARIPVGTNDVQDRPRGIAITGDGARAYVALENSGRVALVDPMVLHQIDTNAETKDIIDPIELGVGASPRSIVIDSRSEYAYIADGRMGVIYVLNINPNSLEYHRVVEKIQVKGAPFGLREMAISSDGRRLFATAPSSNSANAVPQQKSQIIVINIDPKDRPKNPAFNQNNWHKQIGSVEADRRVEGISATNNPNQMVFTNRQNDKKGYGVLEITQNDPAKFAASTRYASLNLGAIDDYFDVNNAISVAITRDGEYGFVVGHNGGPFMQNGGFREDVDGVQAGSSVGIISRPLGPNPQLIAATRPIPLSFATDLVLSNDDKYLYVANPNGVGVMTYDVDEIIRTLNNPGEFVIDEFDRGELSQFFDSTTARTVEYLDFERVPVDDINPNISVTADYGIIKEDRRRNQFTYGVLNVPDGRGGWVESPLGPIGTYVSEVVTTPPDWLTLIDLGVTDDLTPTFKWDIKYKTTGKDVNVSKVELFVSVFDKGKGLLPEDKWPEISSLTPNKDYNPNRILTATWSKKINQDKKLETAWSWGNETRPASENRFFELPDNRMLTAGQKYYWAVRAYTSDGKLIEPKTGEFTTSLPSVKGNVFSNVTILTRGLEHNSQNEIDSLIQDDEGIAQSITDYNRRGLTLYYDSQKADWYWKNGSEKTYVIPTTAYGNPLVLVADWPLEPSNKKLLPPEYYHNTGFAEAAADTLFASLVQLNTKNLGKIFKSSLHFIGFGEGAIINTEIIQRIGTYFPDAYDGGTSGTRPDLQMTTIDAFNPEQTNFLTNRNLVLNPEVTVWRNVSYADNYYQTINFNSQNFISGNELVQADFNQALDFANFKDANENNHLRSLAWYAGTVNLSNAEYFYQFAQPNNNQQPETEPVFRRLGDIEANFNSSNPKPQTWYTPNHNAASFANGHGSEDAPWEGIGTGWFHSILGSRNQQSLRPRNNSSQENRSFVWEDNTEERRLRGDYAVPTLFNGNFDAITVADGKQVIPGWSFAVEEDKNDSKQNDLTLWNSVPGLRRYGQLVGETEPNYALKMGIGGTTSITHNPFVVPEWGELRFNIHAPNEDAGKALKVYIKELGENKFNPIKTISLNEAKGTPAEYERDLNRIGYGSRGFETFTVDIDEKYRNKVAILKFEYGGKTIYLDDVFFQSEHLKFGNPTEARYDKRIIDENQFQLRSNNYVSNLLLEKPQYAVSYNENTLNPNWVGWQLNPSWLDAPIRDGERIPIRSDVFVADPQLPTRWAGVSESWYKQDINDRESGTLGYDVGHGVSSGERQKSKKDNMATFLGTNTIPQSVDNNRFFGEDALATASAWRNIERQAVDLARQGAELYIYAGSFGRKSVPSEVESNAFPHLQNKQTDLGTLHSRGINVPEWTWKTILVLEEPGLDVVNVNIGNARVETYITPNVPEPFPNGTWQAVPHPLNALGFNFAPITSVAQWRNPETWQVELWRLQDILNAQRTDSVGFNFLSNIRDENIRNALTGRPITASLLANEEDIPVLTETSSVWTTNGTELNNNFPIGTNSIPQYGIQQPSVLPISSFQVSTTQVNSDHLGTSQIGVPQIGVPQVSMIHFSEKEIGTTQVSSPEIDLIQNSPFQVSTPQVSTTQDSSSQLDTTQISSIEVGAMDNYVVKLSLPTGITLEQFLNLNYPSGVVINTPVWHSGITEKGSFLNDVPPVSTQQVGISQISATHLNSSQIGTAQVSKTQVGFSQISSPQISTTQVSPPQVGVLDVGSLHTGVTQVGSTEINVIFANPTQVSTFENGIPQILSENTSSSQINTAKVSLSRGISLQQFFAIHTLTPTFYNISKDNLLNLWSTLFDPTNPFDLTFQITNLPTGQLAEAQITKFDSLGRPNGGTLLIDDDANDVGWFIDTTPLDNSEFDQTLADTAFRATTGNAVGKYDLLTTILHETGHLLGIINGNSGFDSNVQTLNGKKVFVGKDFTATLTLDGSHLDSKVHPYDLMNNTLAPGVRKLPSLLNLQIINAIRSTNTDVPQRPTNLSPQPFFLPVTPTNYQSTYYQPITPTTKTSQAPLTAILLAEITNGDFTIDDPKHKDFGWSTRGAATILNSQAVLTEDSPTNSNFTQSFIVPERAKYLQFTIVDSFLGTSDLAPPDAFEVALLDARTLTPLVGTPTGLTQTDSLFNLQHNGQTYFSPTVSVAGASSSGSRVALNTPRTVKVDISSITPGTVATLYFDLLGFGARDGKVVIDNVMLLSDELFAPTANDDTATTASGKPVAIAVLSNDSDADGTINPNSIQIGAAPTKGTIIINSDGTIIYTPNRTFIGTDTFTYIVADNDSAISNEATVTVTVNNAAPTISNIALVPNLREGIAATFSATATDNGNDTLSYTWNFGDGSNPVTGQTVSHTFLDNGTYTATLTVTDTFGASVVQTLSLNVNNVAPTAQALDDFAVNEGTAISLNGSFTDRGILDTHRITWDFGDGTILEYLPPSLPHSLPPSYLNPTHTWTNNGNYTVTFTVTDNDGGVSSDTVSVRVNNVAPTITNLSGDTTLNSGATANFRASATDRGNDTLIYTWDFGDGSDVAKGQNSSHIFTKAGIYTVTLTVVDSDGASTQETLTVNVNNHAVPLITDIPVPKKVYQNDPVAFTASVSAADDASLTYIWNFGDGTQPVEGLSPTHVFAQSGEYTTTLTVINATGASDIKTVTVYVGSTAPEPGDDENLPDWDGDFSSLLNDLEDLNPDIFTVVNEEA